MIKNKKGFTLVELLAVIVILAIILVIAVPQIMKTIDSSRDGAFSASAKLIATSAEKEYLARKTIGDTSFEGLYTIPCSDVVKENKNDYQSCDISFDENGKATVQLEGQGKFKGKNICAGTRKSATITEEKCPSIFETHSWEKIISTIQEANKKSIDYPYEIGDTKPIKMNIGDGEKEYTLRIANKTECDEEWMNNEEKSQTACGFVLEFVEVIGTHVMNSTTINAGGWPESEMRTYLNDTTTGIYSKIPATLRNAIINTTVISSYESGKTANYSSEDKLYLLSPVEVYGFSFKNSSDTSKETSRQLDYYGPTPGMGVTTSNRGGAIKKNLSGAASGWWLRSASFGDSIAFFRVAAIGFNGTDAANSTSGVSPAFRIG